MDNQDLTLDRQMKAKDELIAELLEVMGDLCESLHDLNKADINIVVLMASLLKAKRTIKKHKGD